MVPDIHLSIDSVNGKPVLDYFTVSSGAVWRTATLRKIASSDGESGKT